MMKENRTESERETLQKLGGENTCVRETRGVKNKRERDRLLLPSE